MSCSPEILKDYLLGELSSADEKRLREHLSACTLCGEEWDRLQLTHTALLAVPDQEPPRRTAFVSDKVFAPTWWQRVWGSGPQLGFLSAGLLAAAVLAHGVITRPAPPVAVQNAAPNMAVIQTQVEQEVEKRLRPLIAQAVADSEARVAKRDAELVRVTLQEAEKRLQSTRRVDLARVQESFEYLQSRVNTNAVLQNNSLAGRGEGE